MPLPDSPGRKLHHTRQLNVLGHERPDGLWEIEAHLLDTKPYWFPNHEKNGVDAGEAIHQFSLRVTLDLGFLIHAVEVSMDDTPFGICRQVEANMKRLEGLRIGPGWLKEARDRIPRSDSCTHLMDLLNPIATTAYQSMHATLEERRQNLPVPPAPPIIDQCHSLSSHTDVVKVKWPEFFTGTQSQESRVPVGSRRK